MRPGMDTGFRRYDGGGGFVPFVGTLPKVVTNVIEWDSNPFSLNGRGNFGKAWPFARDAGDWTEAVWEGRL